MRFLHLSDIHFNNGAESIVLRDSLLEYLEKYIGNVNYCFITGDYRNANSRTEIGANEVADFIRQIADKVNVEISNIIIETMTCWRRRKTRSWMRKAHILRRGGIL